MQSKNSNRTALLWVSTGVLFVAFMFSYLLYSEYNWLWVGVLLLLFASVVGLIFENRKSLRSRSAAYGANSFVTIVLVIGIVAVLNFLGNKYPYKADFTKSKKHTLSEQTIKVLKGLNQPVKATFFAKQSEAIYSVRPLLDNLKAQNPKFEVEYVDPFREPTRARQAQVTKEGVLQLAFGARTSKIEQVTEEKITNELIKITKDKTDSLCAVSGHGEKSITSREADGYEMVRQYLVNQAYNVREVNLFQDAKFAETCTAIAIIGPNKAFLPQEIKAIEAYLAGGGRAVVALDVNLKGPEELAPELVSLLQTWQIKAEKALVIDPMVKNLPGGGDYAVTFVDTYAPEHAITKNFKNPSLIPFARPISLLSTPGSGITTQWLAKTRSMAWGVTDLSQLKTGKISKVSGRDIEGPVTIAATAEGKLKDSKAAKNTRIVVFGSSYFASNQYSRFGGNLDFFLNSVSWVLEDESLISVRAKEDQPGKLELTPRGTGFVGFVILFIPIIIGFLGIAIWIYRRRL